MRENGFRRNDFCNQILDWRTWLQSIWFLVSFFDMPNFTARLIAWIALKSNKVLKLHRFVLPIERGNCAVHVYRFYDFSLSIKLLLVAKLQLTFCTFGSIQYFVFILSSRFCYKFPTSFTFKSLTIFRSILLMNSCRLSWSSNLLFRFQLN